MSSGLLMDIGGTYARLAGMEAGKPARIEKYAAADFSSLEEILKSYAAQHGAGDKTLLIATAAWPREDGVWHFVRDDHWVIDPAALEKAGWRIVFIGNDFAAGARGAVSLPLEGCRLLQTKKEKEGTHDRVAVLGAGTGLGLAYVTIGSGAIQETYGGHMEIPQRTDEQHMIVKLVHRLKGNDRPVSAEDILSGAGLVLLYGAVCIVHGHEVTDMAPEDILEKRETPLFIQALRLFHEFLGMFAHQAVIYGHAYGGLFLDGGVIHRLSEAGLFDAETFLSFLIGDPLPLIREQLEAMPVNIVRDPYVTLRGLAAMAENHEA